MRIPVVLSVLIVSLLIAVRPAVADFAPRTVILLSDPGSQIEAIAAPPLALLGLNVENHSTGDKLPPLAGRDDVRGIVVWLQDGAIADESFVGWVRDAVRAQRPVVMMGHLPDIEDRFGLFLALDLLYAFDDRAYTYDMRVADWDEDIIGFGRRLDPPYPAAPLMRPLDAPLARSALVLERRGNPSDRSHVLIATPKGAFAADGYALWQSSSDGRHAWTIDPVAWFRMALRLDSAPVPDATTVNGRRIFAPAIAPDNPAEGDAAAASALGLARVDGLRLPRLAKAGELRGGAALPICGPSEQMRLLGVGTQLALLDEDDALRRDTPYAPVIGACKAARDFLPSAARAVFQAADGLPLSIQRGDLKAIEAGFRSARVENLPGLAWRIHDRGALQTLRLDNTDLRVDWTASEGLLGAARAFGSLYVALDPDSASPTLVLTRAPYTAPPFPILVEARWIVRALRRTGDRATMTVEGDGPGVMAWSTEPGSHWELRLSPDGGGLRRYRITAGDDGLMAFTLPPITGDRGVLDLIRYYDAARR
jgi:hypothetical protein